MRRSFSVLLVGAALWTVVPSPMAEAQVLDDTMVPRGRVRLQAFGSFQAWDQRYGVLPDGTERLEDLGEDLTDPTSLSLFPGMPSLRDAIRSASGVSTFQPVVGSTDGRVTHDVSAILWGIHVGVFDWLTIGGTLPWVRTRTAVDVVFVPDTLTGNMGLNPTITDASGVNAFLGSVNSADILASENAVAACAGGPSAACSAAQALAGRTNSFRTSMEDAYGATPFFPLSSSEAGTALSAEAATLSADLAAAGLGGLAPLALATDVLATDGFPLLPAAPGSGIEAAALQTRQSLWGPGDMELSARIRLLDNLTPAWSEEVRYSGEERLPRPGFGYRITAHFLTRLPTGTPEDPDILLDIGRGDGQLDLEGGLNAVLRFGSRFGVTAGGRYGTQGETTVVKRVAPHELAMPPAGTRRELTWKPGFYVAAGAAPTFRLADALTLHGEYRFFHKGRDEFALTAADPTLDPVVLALESGVKQHQVGGGLRYATVMPWLAGARTFPMEVHVRALTTFRGSGGQTPRATVIEGGLRIFKRFWGPSR